MRRGMAVAAVLAIAFAMPIATQSAAATSACPSGVSPSAMASVSTLTKQARFLDSLGVRPTGSKAQRRYIGFIRGQLREVPGIEMSHQSWRFGRWVVDDAPRPVRLSVRIAGRWRHLAVAAAVPYSHPTGRRGVTGRLVGIPDATKITAANARGKIVVRPAPPGSVPYAVFQPPVLGWVPIYDPHHTVNPLASFYGDFENYNPRLQDLHDAKAAGARGILFTEELPTKQLRGHYEPYEGQRFGEPALWLGARTAQALAKPAAGSAMARITLRAHYRQAVTSSWFATIPGGSAQRLVVDSHTDGTNVVEDDGPIAMVAMAKYLASLPVRCRPRTIEFSFSTAHFFQRIADAGTRDGAAEQLAEQLDQQYDAGTVGAVMVIEHLGALDEEMVPAPRGPGNELRRTGLSVLDFIAVTPSPTLVAAVESVVQSHDLARTAIIQGADVPGATVPVHCSFGGEGTPFNVHLLPTIGIIAAPQSLYDPAFGMSALSVPLMHREMVAFTDLLQQMGHMPQVELAGTIPAERAARSAGAPRCPASV